MLQSEQTKDIKAIIAAHLERKDVVEKLRKKIREDKIDVDNLDDDGMIELLREMDLLGNIMTDIKTRETKSKAAQDLGHSSNDFRTRFSDARKGLIFTLGQGKAFLDYMEARTDGIALQFCVSFLRHKHYTPKVQAQVEPIFKEVKVDKAINITTE